MKNFMSFFKALLTAVVLLSANFGFAQAVVAVPAGCTVVIPGIGGTVGANPIGKVGHGGIVAMPDPGGGGAFNFTIAGVATTASWSLLGDISNTNVTPNSSPVQPAAGSSANIFTCNKNVRVSENPSTSFPLNNPAWARSKGQVRLAFSQSGCSGQTLTFDIFKSFTASPVTNVPVIVGPACLKPNTVYTYSVDPIVSDNINDPIGIDSYYWSGIPAAYLPGSSPDFYTSADGSSITFKTGASVTPFVLQCCYGRVNPTANNVDGGVSTFTTGAGSHSTCVTKSLTIAPSQPSFSATTFLSTLATMNATVNPSACLATNQSTFTLVYPDPVAATYVWTAPNTGWTSTTASVSGSTTLTVNTNGSTNPGQLTLTINGICDPVVINYQINRSITAPFTVIPTGATTTCLNSTSTGNTYTLSPNSGGNSIEWVTIPGTNPASAPAAVAGVTLLNANTATVTVNTTGATGNFLLVARSSVAACNNTFVYTQINMRPAAPTVVSGTTPPTCVPLSSAGLTTFSVSSPGATSYTWTLPAGWVNSGTTAQQTSGNPTLIPPVNTSTVGAAALPAGTISVVANSAAGCSSTQTNFTVNYVRITTNTLQPGAGNCDQYSINTNAAPCTGTITNWTVNGVTAVNSATVNIFGNTLTLCGSTAPPAGTVCANIVINGVTYNTCSSTVATGTHGLRQAAPKVVLDGVKISPNPNNGNFSIKVDGFKESANATLTDFSGNEISKYTLIKGENKISNEHLVSGSYFIVLSVDGQQETRQIIVK